jgi:multiple sugar transport system permease protein
MTAITRERATRAPWAGRDIRYMAATLVGQAIIYALLFVLAAIELMPLMFTFSTSLRYAAESAELPPRFFPTSWRWENYVAALSNPQIKYPLYFVNSVKVAVITLAGQLLTCSMAGFAFARLRFRGRDLLFFVFLASMMIPGMVTQIPLFVLIRILGLIDTHWALILPSLTSAFGVFLLRQYFMTLPSELIDAAKIDGAGFFHVYWRIMLPLAGPALSALGIMTFLNSWNNFYGPLLFLRTRDTFTLPVALVMVQQQYVRGTGGRAVYLAAVFLSLLPILVFFLAAQRFVIKGIAVTGLGGK